ncbi:hypothetical protein C8R48DRAFT_781962 [Suillus tomentosus]|nr:hypothetical protein C8R48DRAFT_781962 [Suillus tomentosus]
MSSANNIAAANKAFSDAANKIDHLLGQASQLDAVDARHLTIAMEMGKVLTQVMMSHGGSTTVLSPLILSAAAELQQHMNISRTGLTGTPVWANIRGDDVCIQTHPLFPSTRNYRRSPPPSPPSQGPSKPRKRPVVEEPEERGRGTERGKRARAPSTRSRSCPAMSKRQRQKSRAVASSDDELDEEIPATPAIPTTTKARRQYVEIDTEEDMDEDADEEDAMEPSRTSTAAVAALPITSGPDLMEDEFANPMAVVWAPRCGQCVARDLICRQGYHKDHGGKLRVCALCSRLKIRCRGKGSDAPRMKQKSVTARRAHSQSRRRRSPVAGKPWPFDSGHLPNPTDPPVHAPAISEVEEEQPPMAQSQDRAEPALASTSNSELQDLRDEVASLRATVEALLLQSLNGDRRLREREAAQDERAKLLADELEGLCRLVLSVTAQSTAETPPTNVHPGVQSPSAATAQPTPATEIQPSAAPSSVPSDDTSVQPARNLRVPQLRPLFHSPISRPLLKLRLIACRW